MGQRRRRLIRLLQAQEETLNVQIAELEEKLDELLSEQNSIRRQKRTLEMAEESSKLTKMVSKVNKDNSTVVHLYSSTRTTPIIDNFAFSDKDFLVFRHLFRLSPSWKYVSLIVVKNRTGINYTYSGLTMTDLKKAAGTHVSKNLVEQFPKSDRLYPLYLELARISEKVAMTSGPIRFDTPCMLGGQTFREQTGFGWEYCGEEVVRYGREYGETTKFMIIGVWVDSNE